ncbi:MAG: hypothetical protein IPF98_04990 [Gemmatimonadetes bacterium]|nr:hypothetical protein [Gemmatimonadota bacterium]
MFHEGSTPRRRDSGRGEGVMYFALFNFGRRWERPVSCDLNGQRFLAWARCIRMHSDITLSAIERLSPAALRQQ